MEIILIDNNLIDRFYTIDCHAESNHLDWDYHQSKKEPVSKSHSFIEPIIICGSILTNELSKNVKGDILEFGCFTGISSAKLSIIAKQVNKKLFIKWIFDICYFKYWFIGCIFCASKNYSI